MAAASPAESVAGRAQRYASLQQPGPLDDDGDPGGAEYRDRGALRSVAGQHRRRVSGRGAGGGGCQPAGSGADRELGAGAVYVRQRPGLKIMSQTATTSSASTTT